MEDLDFNFGDDLDDLEGLGNFEDMGDLMGDGDGVFDLPASSSPTPAPPSNLPTTVPPTTAGGEKPAKAMRRMKTSDSVHLDEQIKMETDAVVKRVLLLVQREKLSLAQLADRIDVPKSSFSNWVKKRTDNRNKWVHRSKVEAYLNSYESGMPMPPPQPPKKSLSTKKTSSGGMFGDDDLNFLDDFDGVDNPIPGDFVSGMPPGPPTQPATKPTKPVSRRKSSGKNDTNPKAVKRTASTKSTASKASTGRGAKSKAGALKTYSSLSSNMSLSSLDFDGNDDSGMMGQPPTMTAVNAPPGTLGRRQSSKTTKPKKMTAKTSSNMSARAGGSAQPRYTPAGPAGYDPKMPGARPPNAGVQPSDFGYSDAYGYNKSGSYAPPPQTGYGAGGYYDPASGAGPYAGYDPPPGPPSGYPSGRGAPYGSYYGQHPSGPPGGYGSTGYSPPPPRGGKPASVPPRGAPYSNSGPYSGQQQQQPVPGYKGPSDQSYYTNDPYSATPTMYSSSMPGQGTGGKPAAAMGRVGAAAPYADPAGGAPPGPSSYSGSGYPPGGSGARPPPNSSGTKHKVAFLQSFLRKKMPSNYYSAIDDIINRYQAQTTELSRRKQAGQMSSDLYSTEMRSVVNGMIDRLKSVCGPDLVNEAVSSLKGPSSGYRPPSQPPGPPQSYPPHQARGPGGPGGPNYYSSPVPGGKGGPPVSPIRSATTTPNHPPAGGSYHPTAGAGGYGKPGTGGPPPSGPYRPPPPGHGGVPPGGASTGQLRDIIKAWNHACKCSATDCKEPHCEKLKPSVKHRREMEKSGFKGKACKPQCRDCNLYLKLMRYSEQSRKQAQGVPGGPPSGSFSHPSGARPPSQYAGPPGPGPSSGRPPSSYPYDGRKYQQGASGQPYSYGDPQADPRGVPQSYRQQAYYPSSVKTDPDAGAYYPQGQGERPPSTVKAPTGPPAGSSGYQSNSYAPPGGDRYDPYGSQGGQTAPPYRGDGRYSGGQQPYPNEGSAPGSDSGVRREPTGPGSAYHPNAPSGASTVPSGSGNVGRGPPGYPPHPMGSNKPAPPLNDRNMGSFSGPPNSSGNPASSYNPPPPQSSQPTPSGGPSNSSAAAAPYSAGGQQNTNTAGDPTKKGISETYQGQYYASGGGDGMAVEQPKAGSTPPRRQPSPSHAPGRPNSNIQPESIDLTEEEGDMSNRYRQPGGKSGKRGVMKEEAEGSSMPEHKRRKTYDNLEVLENQGSTGDVKLPPSPIKEPKDLSDSGRKDSSSSSGSPQLKADPVKTKQVYEGNFKEEQSKMVVDFERSHSSSPGHSSNPAPAPMSQATVPMDTAKTHGTAVGGMTGETHPADTAGGGTDSVRLLCVICQDADRQLLFSPCHHISSCVKCGNGLENCPICRTRIDERSPIFLS